MTAERLEKNTADLIKDFAPATVAFGSDRSFVQNAVANVMPDCISPRRERRALLRSNNETMAAANFGHGRTSSALKAAISANASSFKRGTAPSGRVYA